MRTIKPFGALILSILSLNILAQDPDYFAGNPQWRENFARGDESPCIEEQHYVYYINGDSTINDTVYHKIYKRGLLDHSWWDSPPIPDYCTESHTFNDFYALVRQKGYKIFDRSWWGDKDILLYDFDLAVGDTVPETVITFWPGELIVTSIDSLPVNTGYRRIFSLSGGSIGPPQLIEGIGHRGGFLEPFDQFEYVFRLVCFALNDTTYYPELDAPCDLTVNIPKENRLKELSCYPNPSKNIITIQCNHLTNLKGVFAYDITGRETNLEFNKISRSAIIADLSPLKNGLYVIRIIDDKNTYQPLKVVKE